MRIIFDGNIVGLIQRDLDCNVPDEGPGAAHLLKHQRLRRRAIAQRLHVLVPWSIWVEEKEDIAEYTPISMKVLCNSQRVSFEEVGEGSHWGSNRGFAYSRKEWREANK